MSKSAMVLIDRSQQEKLHIKVCSGIIAMQELQIKVEVILEI